jgi:hypothetical protein
MPDLIARVRAWLHPLRPAPRPEPPLGTCDPGAACPLPVPDHTDAHREWERDYRARLARVEELERRSDRLARGLNDLRAARRGQSHG